ncbi:MAG: hypothetical protein WC307_01335 [Candidatus Nanoarchaeia archaeon]
MADVFKEYDIRGELNDEFVNNLGACFAGQYGSVVVMSDTKESSKHLASVFSQAVSQAGFNVINCGSGPTDMCSVAGAYYNLPSVMFTASHLADDCDGVKFHDERGAPFTSSMVKGLKGLKPVKLLFEGVVSSNDFFKCYCDKVINRYQSLFKQGLKGLKVLVDLKNGCSISPILLTMLGAEVDVVNTNGSDPCNGGINELKAKAVDYDLVLVHDFDGDRVVVVNKNGLVHGSLIACMLTELFKGEVVASIDTSQLLTKLAKVIFSRVGDPFVAEKIIAHGACLGVEPSGHYIDPVFCLTSSGSLFALLIAGLIVNKSLSNRLAELPPVLIKRNDLMVNDKKLFMKNVLMRVNDKFISDVDGLKFIFKNSVALIRPSGTEQLIRIQLEGIDDVKELVGWLA